VGFTADTVVRDLAARAKLSAQQVYDIIMTAPKAAGEHLEGKAGGGIGWKTLAQFCTDEDLDLAAARARLNAKGYTIDEAQTLRELAATTGQKPYELVELLRAK
jgi:hypothetical protein